MPQFWDVVVLTAIDEVQKYGFQAQLNAMLAQDRIPGSCLYRVYEDWPSNVKIGGGGATLVAINALYGEFGIELFSFRVLLIHAGGYSQRQPNASVMGKLFTVLPKENKQGGPYTMLELKLDLYNKFLQRMKPGIFLTSSDAMEGFSVDSADDWTFENDGFTVLAHPSSVEIGIQHGVYVFENELDINKNVSMERCVKVLQKPSFEQMLNSGAVRQLGEESVVFTDSAFYFSASVVKVLLEFYCRENPVQYELDPYGDYLQPLGRNATSDYVSDFSRIVSQTTEPETARKLSALRSRLFEVLHGFNIHAVVLQNSKFYHIGTLPELVHHFTSDESFQRWFSTKRIAFSALVPLSPSSGDIPISENSTRGCVIHSILSVGSVVPKQCLIEFCDFSETFQLAEGCVLSNCVYNKPFSIDIPVLIYTVAITVNNSTFYTGLVFGTFDNIKNKALPSQLKYMGQESVENCLPALSTNDSISLWEAKMFKSRGSPEEAFETVLEHIQHHIKVQDNSQLLSASEVLQFKNVAAMLNFRENLAKKIEALIRSQ